jgi:hypothetical protein
VQLQLHPVNRIHHDNKTECSKTNHRIRSTRFQGGHLPRFALLPLQITLSRLRISGLNKERLALLISTSHSSAPHFLVLRAKTAGAYIKNNDNALYSNHRASIKPNQNARNSADIFLYLQMRELTALIHVATSRS